MTNARIPGLVLAAILLSAAASGAAPPPPQEKQQEPKKDSKSAGDSMTGCVDERDGRYVLTNDGDLATIAFLEADGFPTESFAKHLGHKVTVRGTVIPGGTQPTFKVRSVAAISDSCAPQQQR